MRMIEITNGPVTIPAGVCFQLEGDQLRRRARMLEKIQDDVFESNAATQWKTGEVIITDWVIDKSMMNHAQYVSDEPEQDADHEEAAGRLPTVDELLTMRIKDQVEYLPHLSDETLLELAEQETRETAKTQIQNQIDSRSGSETEFGAA